jgi:hypothetical protein
MAKRKSTNGQTMIANNMLRSNISPYWTLTFFDVVPKLCVPSGDATNIDFIVIGVRTHDL